MEVSGQHYASAKYPCEVTLVPTEQSGCFGEMSLVLYRKQTLDCQTHSLVTVWYCTPKLTNTNYKLLNQNMQITQYVLALFCCLQRHTKATKSFTYMNILQGRGKKREGLIANITSTTSYKSYLQKIIDFISSLYSRVLLYDRVTFSNIWL